MAHLAARLRERLPQEYPLGAQNSARSPWDVQQQTFWHRPMAYAVALSARRANTASSTVSLAVLSGFALALLAPIAQRRAPRRAGLLLAMLPVALAAYFLYLLGAVQHGPLRESRPWLPRFDVDLAFFADGLSALFAAIIAGVGAVVLVYSSEYLKGNPLLGRFYAYILAFMAAMLGVALSDNLITLFVFWELTSLSSYLLIGFDHEQATSRKAALQALLVTGGGGLALLAGLLLLGSAAGTFTLSEIVQERGDLSKHALYVPVVLLVLAGAFTKSAQFPFHFWLPNAMAAPTPVSAYLHSATMVKAGIYLMARLSPALGGTPLWSWLLVSTGATTLLVGAWLSVRQTDLKRLLAYSTLSVLGALTLLLGSGTRATVHAAIILLVAHAAYKGALFLVAGCIDHEAGTRDVRLLSGLRKFMPITATVSVLAALSMAGVAPFFGFVSKELLYESLREGGVSGTTSLAVAVAGNVLLGAVAGLAGLKPFFGPPPTHSRSIHDPPVTLWAGPALLALLGLGLSAFARPISGVLASAAAATYGEAVPITLSLWHGVNLTLFLSLGTLLGAVGVYYLRPRLIALTQRAEFIGAYGPGRLYEEGLRALVWLAGAQTRLLQSGSLRNYVAICVAAGVVLTASAFARVPDFITLAPLGEVRVHEATAAVVVLFAGGAATVTRSRLAAVVALGATGYGVALFYILFGAPDLALTQFSVETLSVILFLLVVYRLPPFIRVTPLSSRLRDALIAAGAGVLMTLLVLATAATPHDARVSRWLSDHSLTSANGRNVVNVILVDFRALDTLGEITVLGVAAVGVFALVKLRLAPKNA
jgi:multicomponent Na+:H+ antiporter subunit A